MNINDIIYSIYEYNHDSELRFINKQWYDLFWITCTNFAGINININEVNLNKHKLNLRRFLVVKFCIEHKIMLNYNFDIFSRVECETILNIVICNGFNKILPILPLGLGDPYPMMLKIFNNNYDVLEYVKYFLGSKCDLIEHVIKMSCLYNKLYCLEYILGIYDLRKHICSNMWLVRILCRRGYFDIIKYLVSVVGVDHVYFHIDAERLCYNASMYNHVEILRYFHDVLRFDKSCYTLCYVCDDKSGNMIRFLCEDIGFGIDDLCVDNCKIMYSVLINSNLCVLKYLVEKIGMKKEHVTMFNSTIIYWLKLIKNVGILSYLIEKLGFEYGDFF